MWQTLYKLLEKQINKKEITSIQLVINEYMINYKSEIFFKDLSWGK